MDLHFEPANAGNRSLLEHLSLFPEQAGFIETVHDCLAEADALANWRPVGIYDGETLIGFAMYGQFREYSEHPRVWLDRFLIDKAYQHKGYGKAAIETILCRLQDEYDMHEVYLSVYDDNAPAIHLYRELGFEFNGELDTHGEKVMVLHL